MHSQMVQDILKQKGIADKISDNLIVGEAKNVVCGPNLNGSKVAIYGGYVSQPCVPSGYVDGFFCQSYPGPHEETWVDYSQGAQLVWDTAILNGQQVSLRDIFVDPKLHILVSNQGPFSPHFPNVGGGKPPVGKPKSPAIPPKNTPPTPPVITPSAPPIISQPETKSSAGLYAIGGALGIAAVAALLKA